MIALGGVSVIAPAASGLGQKGPIQIVRNALDPLCPRKGVDFVACGTL